MAVIYKYPLRVAEYQHVMMPTEAEILSLQVQDGVPCIWAKVNDRHPAAARGFVMIGTGHEFFELAVGSHIGTIQLGGFVWHFFDDGMSL